MDLVKILILIVFFSSGSFADTIQQNNLGLENLLITRIDKIKDIMSDSINKIMALHQEVDAGASAFMVLTHFNKDAGPILNSKLNWLNVRQITTGTSVQSILTLSTELKEKLKYVVFDSSFKATDFDLKNLDFGWITELQQFDHWNLEENSPISRLEIWDFSLYPVPDFEPILIWAKLRLIKGLQEKKITAAIDETLHLGRLLHSTETISGALLAISIQEQVLKFASTQQKMLHFNSRELTKSKIYFTVLGNAFAVPFTDGRVYLKLLQINSGPGFCAAINLAAPNLLKYRMILEKDQISVYNGFTSLLKSSIPCRLKIIRNAWSGDKHYVHSFDFLSNLAIKGRKKQTESLKEIVTMEEYQLLLRELSNPRWPQLYVYLLVLKTNIEDQFKSLNLN